MSTILFPRQSQEEAIRLRLEAVRGKDGAGVLRPGAVVDDARNPESPYHKRFEWDDAKAAHKHRLDTAREIIRSVRVNVRTETSVVSTVAYVRDPALDAQTAGYRPVAELRTEHDLAKVSLEREIERAMSALTRVREIAAALDLEDDAEMLIAGLNQLTEKAHAAA